MGYVVVGHDADGSLHVFGTHATGTEYSSESAAVAGRADVWGFYGPARFQDAVVVVVEKAPHIG